MAWSRPSSRAFMDSQWRWMPPGEKNSYRTLPPTPSTRSCARFRQRGPTKRGTKDMAYRRSAIPTRAGSSTRRCWTSRTLCCANCSLLTNYGAVVAEDLDRVGVSVEDAHLHGRCGEQEPEDAAPEVARLRRLDPTYLRVLQVRVGSDEPLQKEAQRDPQGESEYDAAEDQEVEITPAEIQKPQPEGDQEEDCGEQVRGHDGRMLEGVVAAQDLIPEDRP